jgi:hypothetical protein
MKARILQGLVAGLFLTPCILLSQAPAGAPAGTTGKCKDGTYTSTPTKQGACRGHKGVDIWYAAATSAPKTSSSTSSSSAASSTAPASTPKAAAASGGTMPAGATGKCKDGTYTAAPKKQGACRGHQGVDSWFAAEAAPAAAAQKSAVTPAPAATPAPAQASAPSPAAAAPQKSSTRIPASAKTPAPGGAPGLVWVNSSTNVYHCFGTQFYGTTKAGRYMSEADAKAAGARPDRNKPCSAK